MIHNIQKFGIVILSALMLSVIGVYVFYILYNAEWLIGDDAFLLRRTAMGIPFPFSESILPEIGFFRPFDYLHENIVLLFHSGTHSAFEHYIINAVSFVLCMGALIGILWKIIKPKEVCDYAIITFGTIAIASRLIGVYINIFGPIFGVYTYHMLAIFFLCIFLEKDKTWAMALSLFCWAYSMLIYENVCMVLGCMGLFPLLLAYKQLSKNQKIYNYTLIGMAVAFIVTYVYVIYFPPRGQSHYDPAHDTGVGLIDNAWTMIYGQKFIWVAALVWFWRQVQLVRKQTTYHILYDTLLWAAGGMVIGAIVLRLDWAMYYYDAIILSLPAIVYFLINSHTKYGKYVALGVMMLFAAWHSVKVPHLIEKNQKDRIVTSANMHLIAEKALNGWSIVWYDGCRQDSVSEVRKAWRKEATRNYIQYLMKDIKWDYGAELKEYSVVFNPYENEIKGDIPEYCKDKIKTEVGETSGVVYYEIENDNYGYKNENIGSSAGI